jgi:hypothetical protein
MNRPLAMLVAFSLGLALTAPVATSGESGRSTEQIGIQGQWVIDVRGPDGTSVTRREFHNDLVSGPALASLLGGKTVMGRFQVRLGCAPGTQCTLPCAASLCSIFEPDFAFALPPGIQGTVVKTLLLSLPTSGGLRLQGSTVASANGTIGQVETLLTHCDSLTTPPVGCVSSSVGQFPLTTAVLSPAIEVFSGQQVLVTVTITSATATAPSALSSTEPAR